LQLIGGTPLAADCCSMDTGFRASWGQREADPDRQMFGPPTADPDRQMFVPPTASYSGLPQRKLAPAGNVAFSGRTTSGLRLVHGSTTPPNDPNDKRGGEWQQAHVSRMGFSSSMQVQVIPGASDEMLAKSHGRTASQPVIQADDVLGSMLGFGALAGLAVIQRQGPERPRGRQRPPFAWQLAPEYEKEFQVSGSSSETVTKIGDFKEKDWVIPVGSTLRMTKGGLYRWTLCIERTCPHRSQMQLGVHGGGHRRPLRMITTSRLSRASDDEPWRDRPGGDRVIKDGDYLHIEVDLRGLHLPFGTLSMAVNTNPPELVFDDVPLSHTAPMMPVVSMGGDQARIRLCPAY